MGDLSQLAGALGQALGPLAQMMQGQQGGSTPEPYDSGVSTIDTVAGTSLGTTPGAVDGTGIGGTGSSTNGVDFKSPKTNITGFGPASGSFGPSASSMGAAGTDYASGGSDSAGIGNTGYSAGASAGSLNSSGSSMAPGGSDAEKASAAAAEAAGEGLEYNAGAGGGSKPSFLGLKSRGPEEDLGTSTDGGVLGDLGLGEDANRELASNEEGAGIGEEDGNTLFHVVHTKIAEIKRRGSI